MSDYYTVEYLLYTRLSANAKDTQETPRAPSLPSELTLTDGLRGKQ